VAVVAVVAGGGCQMKRSLSNSNLKYLDYVLNI
jgi:hypothetical protein